jgi:hypothetical protein
MKIEEESLSEKMQRILEKSINFHWISSFTMPIPIIPREKQANRFLKYSLG